MSLPRELIDKIINLSVDNPIKVSSIKQLKKQLTNSKKLTKLFPNAERQLIKIDYSSKQLSLTNLKLLFLIKNNGDFIVNFKATVKDVLYALNIFKKLYDKLYNCYSNLTEQDREDLVTMLWIINNYVFYELNKKEGFDVSRILYMGNIMKQHVILEDLLLVFTVYAIEFQNLFKKLTIYTTDSHEIFMVKVRLYKLSLKMQIYDYPCPNPDELEWYAILLNM